MTGDQLAELQAATDRLARRNRLLHWVLLGLLVVLGGTLVATGVRAVIGYDRPDGYYLYAWLGEACLLAGLAIMQQWSLIVAHWRIQAFDARARLNAKILDDAIRSLDAAIVERAGRAGSPPRDGHGQS
jgi:hypothetical protein